MIYLDSNVFIFAQISAEKEGELARLILKAMEEGKFKAITNVITVDEVIWKIKKEVDHPSAIKVGKVLFELLNLDLVGIRPETLKKALKIMERYRLKLRDAIHIASMFENDVSTIITQDPDFKKVKEIKASKFSEFLKKIKKISKFGFSKLKV